MLTKAENKWKYKMNKYKKSLNSLHYPKVSKVDFFFIYSFCSFSFFTVLFFLHSYSALHPFFYFGNFVYFSSRFIDSITVAFKVLNSVGRRMFTFRIHLMFVVSRRHFLHLMQKKSVHFENEVESLSLLLLLLSSSFFLHICRYFSQWTSAVNPTQFILHLYLM